MTDAPTDVPIEAVGLLAQLMQANADHLVGLYQSFAVTEKAKADQLRDGLIWALGTIPVGDTTATYEAGLRRVRSVLYPSYEITDWYRDRAERYFGIGDRPWSKDDDAPHPRYQDHGGLA